MAIVEDACQAHGAQFDGRRVGSFGHGAFSLYGTKNMTTGEGGLITTDDDRLADWIRLYRNQGMRERYHHEILGYNFRLTDIAAAIGLCQLDKLERNTARRQAIAARYDAAFADLPVRARARRPAGPMSSTSTRSRSRMTGTASSRTWLPQVSRRASTTRSRSIASRTSLERGIHADLPVTDHASRQSLSLPMFPGLIDEEQATVIAAVRCGRRAVAGPALELERPASGTAAR